MHEVTNAVDQAKREVGTRFDFKGTNSKFEQDKTTIISHSQSDFQLKQMLDILQGKLTKRGIDITCMEVAEPEISLNEARQTITLKRGIDKELGKKIVKKIKDSRLKVQAAIQGEKIRVTGKKRDDLQNVISFLKGAKLDLPLQYENFRD